MDMTKFINEIPKAELHLHIEGSFEPELMFEIAERNKIQLKYKSIDEIKEAYEFTNLQDFLDIYYAGASVLLYEQDFYDLTMAYLKRVNEQNVIHAEIFFDPQTHTDRGISFDTVISGITKACTDAEKEFGISTELIMHFLRHLSEESAFKTLEEAIKYKNKIIAVGLDSSELGNPPSKFERVFRKAKEYGFLTVAHAGEEGPPEYVREAISLLDVSRIDHGNRSLEDNVLTKELIESQIPLTVCPLSNIKLCNVDKIENHPIKKMLDLGIKATVNSDDPAYFGGYMTENFAAITNALDLSKQEIYTLVKNSFEASFISEEKKTNYINRLNVFYNNHAE